MARTEYYDDPNAPKPNSLVVAASAVVTDEHGRILLQRRRDNSLWALPARIIGGRLAVSDESTELRFVPLDQLGTLPMHHNPTAAPPGLSGASRPALSRLTEDPGLSPVLSRPRPEACSPPRRQRIPTIP